MAEFLDREAIESDSGASDVSSSDESMGEQLEQATVRSKNRKINKDLDESEKFPKNPKKSKVDKPKAKRAAPKASVAKKAVSKYQEVQLTESAGTQKKGVKKPGLVTTIPPVTFRVNLAAKHVMPPVITRKPPVVFIRHCTYENDTITGVKIGCWCNPTTSEPMIKVGNRLVCALTQVKGAEPCKFSITENALLTILSRQYIDIDAAMKTHLPFPSCVSKCGAIRINSGASKETAHLVYISCECQQKKTFESLVRGGPKDDVIQHFTIHPHLKDKIRVWAYENFPEVNASKEGSGKSLEEDDTAEINE